jgi:hypothetical protein
MRKLLLTTVVAIAFAAPASAKVQFVSSYGVWTVYAGTTDKGKPICGMLIKDNTPAGRTLHVKAIDGFGGILLMAWKPGWRIPDETEMPITLGFDRDTFGSTTAYGYTSAGDESSHIEFRVVEGPATAKFLEEFAHADVMVLRFDSGSEVPWSMKMDGSRKAANDFAYCMAKYIRPATTQPYPQASTQPYSQGQSASTLPRPTQ